MRAGSIRLPPGTPSENNTHFYRLRRAANAPYNLNTDRQAANDSLHAQPYTGYAGRYRYTTVELQYTTPAVGESEPSDTTHTHRHPRAQPLRGFAKHTVPPL